MKQKANGDLFIYLFKHAFAFPNCYLNAVQWEWVSVLILLYYAASCSFV